MNGQSGILKYILTNKLSDINCRTKTPSSDTALLLGLDTKVGSLLCELAADEMDMGQLHQALLVVAKKIRWIICYWSFKNSPGNIGKTTEYQPLELIQNTQKNACFNDQANNKDCRECQ